MILDQFTFVPFDFKFSKCKPLNSGNFAIVDMNLLVVLSKPVLNSFERLKSLLQSHTQCDVLVPACVCVYFFLWGEWVGNLSTLLIYEIYETSQSINDDHCSLTTLFGIWKY